MIRPGLERIARLMKDVPLSWKAIHVAGTNGKGSTSTFLSGMLHKSGLKTGRFNSPHLIDMWDCITVNEAPITKASFDDVTRKVMRRNDEQRIDATEFELLTATAFEVFNREHVDVAVVECGMGGLSDSTNILESPILTIITRIGLDHQGFLGNTLAEIATQKAGILKMGAPCIVDASSDHDALNAIKHAAAEKDVICYMVPRAPNGPEEGWSRDQTNFAAQAHEALETLSHGGDQPFSMPATQRLNMLMALTAYTVVTPGLPTLKPPTSVPAFVRSIAENNSPPARFQKIDLSSVNGGMPVDCYLDGAHNVQAWRELFSHVQSLRTPERPSVTWVVACTRGKDAAEMFGNIPEQDTVIFTQYASVDGMPWVQPIPPKDILAKRLLAAPDKTAVAENVVEAFSLVGSMESSGTRNLVIVAGSLYLASDVLRLLRDAQPTET